MPDTLEPTGGGRYPADMESCVAVLEQTARSLLSGQERIERRFDAADRRIDMLGPKQNANFRWLLGTILGGFGAMLGGFSAMLGVMAHGFHWL